MGRRHTLTNDYRSSSGLTPLLANPAFLSRTGNPSVAQRWAPLCPIKAYGNEAADHEILVVADRGVAVAHRGVVFQDFAEQACLLVFEARFGDHGDGGWGIQQWRVVEAGHRGFFGLVVGAFLAKDGDRVLKGLAGLQSGVSEPGGLVNYVSKRPENVRSVTVSTNEHGATGFDQLW